MKAIIVDLTNESGSDANPFTASVSFRKFIDFVKTSAQTETSIRGAYLEKAVDMMTSQPGFSDIISIEETSEYLELLRIVYDLLTPSLQQGANNVWAIGIPLSPVLFYGTDRFYEMIMDLQTGELRGQLMPDEPGAFSDHDQLLPVHQLVMQHLYGIKTPEHKPMVIRIIDKKTGIPQYFRVDVDQRFIDVFPAKQLPKTDSNAIQKLLTGNPDIGSLLKLLPLSHFSFEGISIITLIDVTTEFTLEHIKTIILEKHNWDKNTFYKQITDSLRILLFDPRIDFGLVPLLRVNGKLIFDKETIFHSMSVPIDLPDIRNSTAARNEALRQDLLLQFDLLNRTLTYLSQKLNLFLAQEMSFKGKKFLAEISDSSAHLDEMRINEFLDAEAHPLLRHFLNNYHENKAGCHNEDTRQPVSEIDDIRLSIPRSP